MASAGQNQSTELGFIDDADSWLLTNRYFPSKVGGRAAWLELKNLPDNSDLLCEYCNEPCVFLCQIYAGSQSISHAFHRTIYVFICRNGKCCIENQNGNIKVFRNQLPRKNAFYSTDPPDESIESDEIESPVKLCHLCGCCGPLVCSKCRKISYCSQQHQKLDWKMHKQLCGKEDISLSVPYSNDLLFSEHEIVIEPEELDDSQKHETEKEAEKRRLREYEEMVKSGKAGALVDVSDSDLNDFAETKEDKIFAKFKKITQINPEQILRYCRNGSPMWISEHAILSPSNIPNCQNCKGKRSFEFQIMPQLLTMLQNYELDFGVINIFTCQNDCDVNGKYVKEFCYKQDIIKCDDDEKEIDKLSIEKLHLNTKSSENDESDKKEVREESVDKETENVNHNEKLSKQVNKNKKSTGSKKSKPKGLFEATDNWE